MSAMQRIGQRGESTRADADRRPARRNRLRSRGDHRARRLPRAPDRAAARRRPDRRRAGGAPQGAGRVLPSSTIDLLQTFAAQSVLAIQNARLFREIEEKSRQLEVASQHKSQFLANMSHELRTPLNAILGYTELILDNIYGEVPEKMRGVLERVQSNGKHLLGLINDVLDLSKIEAGQLTLSLADYSLKDVVHSVFARGRAAGHREEARAARSSCRPICRRRAATSGASRRCCSTSSAMRSSSPTPARSRSRRRPATARSRSRCATPAPASPTPIRRKIFEEFQQADSSATKKKGGTGLGLVDLQAHRRDARRAHLGRIRASGRARPSRSRFRSRSSTAGGTRHEQTHSGGRGPGGQPPDPARSAREPPATR